MDFHGIVLKAPTSVKTSGVVFDVNFFGAQFLHWLVATQTFFMFTPNLGED